MVTDWYIRRLIRLLWPTQKSPIPSVGQVVALAKIEQLLIPSTSLFYRHIPVVSQFLAVQDQTNATKQRVLSIAASLAAAYSHTIFAAFSEVVLDESEPLRELEVDHISPLGLTGKLDRTWYILGDALCMQQEQIELGVTIQAVAQKFELEGSVVLILAQRQPKRVLGIFAVSNLPLPDARGIVHQIGDLGISARILTSFPRHVADYMPQQIGTRAEVDGLSIKEKQKLVASFMNSRQGIALLLDARSGGVDPYPISRTQDQRTIVIGSIRGVTEDEGLLHVRNLSDLLHLIEVSRRILQRARRVLFWKRF